MFGNLHWTNVAILVLLALFIFGDKLPQIVGDGLRLLRNLRRMAQNATSDLSKELGTDITLQDLHPKAFVRKHLLSEADQQALIKPLKEVSDDMLTQVRGVEGELRDVGRRTEQVTGDLKRAARPRTGTGRSRLDSPDGPPAGEPAPPPAQRPSFDDIT